MVEAEIAPASHGFLMVPEAQGLPIGHDEEIALDWLSGAGASPDQVGVPAGFHFTISCGRGLTKSGVGRPEPDAELRRLAGSSRRSLLSAPGTASVWLDHLG